LRRVAPEVVGLMRKLSNQRMLVRFFHPLLLLLLLSRASFPAAIDQPLINSCEPKQYNYSSYENSPAPIMFVGSEFWRVVDCNRDDISATSTVVIAIFTIVLGLFTISLAKSTRIAANAAQKALSDLERPWVFVSEITPRHGSDGKILIPFIEYNINNHGRATAIIKKRSTGMILVNTIPYVPPFDRTESVEEWMVLEPMGKFPTSQRCSDRVDIDTFNKINGGLITCLFFGKIEYEGPSGAGYITRFGYIHDPVRARGGETFENDRFIVRNKNVYNEYT
jgi:hypothetical protein